MLPVNLALMFRDSERVFSSADPLSRLILSYSAWLPSLGWLREDPGFYAHMQERGAVGFWEAHGFPRGCRPVDDPAGRRLDGSGSTPGACSPSSRAGKSFAWPWSTRPRRSRKDRPSKL